MPEVNPNQNLEQVEQIDQQPEQQVSAAEVQAEALARADQTVASAERLAALAEQNPERTARVEANRNALTRAQNLSPEIREQAIQSINRLNLQQERVIERTLGLRPDRFNDAREDVQRVAMVIRFQEIRGLNPTGIIDQNTGTELNRIDQEQARALLQDSAVGGLNITPSQVPQESPTIQEPNAVAAGTPSRERTERANIFRNTALAGLDLSQGPEPIQPQNTK